MGRSRVTSTLLRDSFRRLASHAPGLCRREPAPGEVIPQPAAAVGRDEGVEVWRAAQQGLRLLEVVRVLPARARPVTSEGQVAQARQAVCPALPLPGRLEAELRQVRRARHGQSLEGLQRGPLPARGPLPFQVAPESRERPAEDPVRVADVPSDGDFVGIEPRPFVLVFVEDQRPCRRGERGPSKDGAHEGAESAGLHVIDLVLVPMIPVEQDGLRNVSEPSTALAELGDGTLVRERPRVILQVLRFGEDHVLNLAMVAEQATDGVENFGREDDNVEFGLARSERSLLLRRPTWVRVMRDQNPNDAESLLYVP